MSSGSEPSTNSGIDSSIQFKVLGPVTAEGEDGPLNVGGPKQRTVLAMLIASIGRPVSNDSIAEAVYADEAPDRARRRVQTYISTLRSVLGDVIVKEGAGWSLRVDRSQVDSLRFEDLYFSVRNDPDLHPETAGRVLREALALWRGHPFGEVESHGVLDAEETRLEELRVAAQAARIDADLRCGRHADLIGEIQGLVTAHPYVETFRAQHMLALYRAGRQREALRSYRDLRDLLVEELGVEPSPEVQRLETLILDHDASLDLAPVRQIRKKAVLVADPGDPIELARLPITERERLLGEAIEALRTVMGDRSLTTAGAASYAMFDSVGEAASAAEQLGLRTGGPGLRIAIDYGDVETSESGISGAPVSRAAVLVSVAHQGQVLLSSQAQQALIGEGIESGLRFESLGSFELVGVGQTSIFQLLTGDPPAAFPPLDIDRVPVRLPDGTDRSVPGYELREASAHGSLGTLYRAYQPSAGREVLVEVIDRSQASDPDFILRFEADAQRLAFLDHPNINPLLDYWRDPQGAYLVYRHHRGGLLQVGQVADPGRLLTQVGSALDYAHSYGVVHGSVRPDRIALDESGNAFLMGFPVAGRISRSSPDHAAYIAPETIRGDPPGVATDIYALGVLAQELLYGEQASADQLIRPGSAAIERAISEEPADRHASVADFLTEMRPDSGPRKRPFSESRNPYKGLAAFHEADAGDFFGRSRITDELVTALATSGLLAVVGPSGVGKSSVVRAGLTPALRGGALPGSERWIITEMLPGQRPFLELLRALERVTVELSSGIRGGIVDRERHALTGLRRLLPDGAELVLVIDQFEELFTMGDPEAAAAFLDLVLSAVGSAEARIVITLRADFLDRPLQHPEFGELLRESMVALASPNEAELAEAIIGPAQRVGVEVSPQVVERLVGEAHGHPGGLPLLQDALVDLFAGRTSNLIGPDDYHRIGGVAGSIARRAEGIYASLIPHQRQAIQQVFLRLLSIFEDAPPARRRVPLSGLEDLQAGEAIDAFARHRMLVFDKDPLTHAPTVELAHEALLTQWPRLQGWIDAAREDLTLLRRLDDAVRDWEGSGRDSATLLTGTRLAQHRAWTATTSLTLTRPQLDLVAASTAWETQAKTRSNRIRGLVLTTLAGVAAVAIGFAAAAEQQTRVAEAESLAARAVVARETDPELALLLAIEAFDRSPSPSSIAALRSGIQGNRVEMIIPAEPGWDGNAGAVDPSGKRVAVVALNAAHLQMWEVGAAEPTWTTTLADDPNAGFRFWSHLWFSEDGTRLYVPLSVDAGGASADQGVYTLDTVTGETVAFLPLSCLLRVTPAGRHFAVAGAPWAFDRVGVTAGGECDPEGVGTAGVFDIETGEIAFEVTKSGGGPPGLSADGRRLVSASFYPVDDDWLLMVRVFDTATGEDVFETDLVGGGVISADGSRLLIGQNPTYLYDIATGQRLQTYQGDFIRVFFTPDETRVIGAGPEGVFVFDTDSGFELMQMRLGARTASADLAGEVLVSSHDSSVRVWDIASPSRGELAPIPLETDLEDRFPPGALTLSEGLLLVRRSRVDLSLGAGSSPHRVDILRIEDGATIGTFEVWTAELGPGGVLFVQPILETGVTTPAGTSNAVHIGSPMLIDLVGGSPDLDLDDCDWYWIGEFTEPEPGPACDGRPAPEYTAVEFAENGSRVLAATRRGAVTVWDLSTGSALHRENPTWNTPHLNRWGSALSPDGSLMIVLPGQDEVASYLAGEGDRPMPRVVDVVSGVMVARIPSSSMLLTHARFDPVSGLVVVVGANHQGFPGELSIVDPTDDWSGVEIGGPQGGNQMAVSPDGRLVATALFNEFVVVWDIDDRRVVDEIPIFGWIGEGLRGVAFEDDETLVVAPESGRHLLRFTLDPDRLIDLALGSVRRGFTAVECATFAIDPCPAAAQPSD